jgi:hypothetical protein
LGFLTQVPVRVEFVTGKWHHLVAWLLGCWFGCGYRLFQKKAFQFFLSLVSDQGPGWSLVPWSLTKKKDHEKSWASLHGLFLVFSHFFLTHLQPTLHRSPGP